MNTILKITAGGALALAAAAANASIGAPSSGSSDAILFAEVLNSSGGVVASYAGDTGVSISALYNGTNTVATALSGDANLQALFNADVGTDTLYWSLQGGQYSGGNTSATNFKTPGVAQFITTAVGDSGSNIAPNVGTGNFTSWAAGLNADVQLLNTNFNGHNSVEANNVAAGGIWDLNAPNSNVSNWYNNGVFTDNTSLTAQLYSVTGGGTKNSPVTVNTLGSATLSASGLSLPVSAVPLPPAVWLLGSGLLGLAGIARRKSKV